MQREFSVGTLPGELGGGQEAGRDELVKTITANVSPSLSPTPVSVLFYWVMARKHCAAIAAIARLKRQAQNINF